MPVLGTSGKFQNKIQKVLPKIHRINDRSFERKTAMSFIFHITPRKQWEAAIDRYEDDTLATDGFIHCSELRQVVTVANRFYAGQSGLVLLKIAVDRLQPELRYEAADGDEFPHLYGALNLDAVVGVINFEPSSEGFKLPPELIEEAGE
jgi:uncharacterized protein (DUF952 family)